MIEPMGAPGFVRLVARMTIRGDCEDHKHNLEACTDKREPDDPVCCDVACTVHAPSGDDQDVDALYNLIALARRMEASQTA